MSDFETVPVGTLAERDRLNERLALEQRAYDALLGDYQRMTEERNALAAHVERLRPVIHRLTDAMYRYQMDAEEEPPGVHRAMMRDAEALLAEKPATSLTRLIAEKKAEALNNAAEAMSSPLIDEHPSILLQNMAAEIRRQAEEAKQ